MHLPALFPSWLLNIPLGWIVVVIIVLLLSFDAMRSGPGRAVVLAIASPISIFLFEILPQTFLVGKMFTALSASFVIAGIALAIYIVIYLLLHRMTATFSGLSTGLLNSLLAGISGTIAFIILWLQIPALVSLWNPGSQIDALFGLPYALLWFLGSFLVLAFVRS